eukprot:761001-Prorocentrum_minimum.AAC.1
MAALSPYSAHLLDSVFGHAGAVVALLLLLRHLSETQSVSQSVSQSVRRSQSQYSASLCPLPAPETVVDVKR